mgnify:CR=1 FL=1
MSFLTNMVSKVMVESVGNIIDKAIPNKAQAVQIKDNITPSQVEEILLQNMSINGITNLIDANSGSGFISGWRAFTGWVLASALVLYLFIIAFHLFVVALSMFHLYPPSEAQSYINLLPSIDYQSIVGLLGTMLGWSGLRTFEKLKGIDTQQIVKSK